ncbi:MAG: hypothetical protein RIM23_03470 [Coleofasciculus sp. G3-WIS-01]|uniref:hypothetical protein n=1 Tax=Coleofasciculus sp. G3-WIS-01 TaxID=3069528 RepID=UPI0032FA3138
MSSTIYTKLDELTLPRSPRSVPKPDPSKLTEYSCPSCGKSLELYEYQKEGQPKKMLRCANPASRHYKCKDVAYFWTKKGTFWSPKFGEVKNMPLSQAKGQKAKATRKANR